MQQKAGYVGLSCNQVSISGSKGISKEKRKIKCLHSHISVMSMILNKLHNFSDKDNFHKHVGGKITDSWYTYKFGKYAGK